MRKSFYILLALFLISSCQRESVLSNEPDYTAPVNFVMTRTGGWAYDGSIAYDPVADTLYLIAEMDGKRDTSIYTLRSKAADTIYQSDKPFYYEDVKTATFSIFGYGNVGYETAGRIFPYPEFDQRRLDVFERNNYVRSSNLHLSKVNEALPMSASNHVLKATLEPQFTLLHVNFNSNGNDDVVDSVVFITDNGYVYPQHYNNAYRAILDPSNVRPPLQSGQIPNKDNAIMKFYITRYGTNEKLSLYAGYTLNNGQTISDFKGKKITVALGFVGDVLNNYAVIEDWDIMKCTGTAEYIRQ